MENENRIKKGLNEAMGILLIDRMPTSKELRSIGMNWLDTLIGRNGGLTFWAKELNLGSKKLGTNVKESDVEKDIKKLVETLNLKRMPVTNEVLESEFGNTLHNCIGRLGGYRYFAERLNLPIKDSETKLGQDFEYNVIDMLREKGYKVEKMSTGHPYDILVDGKVKVDVKVSSLAIDKDGNRVHTFGLNKRHASCDIYICVTLDENKEIERILVIPSHHTKIVTLCIGVNSKYNKYNGKFEYIKQYTEFFKSVI